MLAKLVGPFSASALGCALFAALALAAASCGADHASPAGSAGAGLDGGAGSGGSGGSAGGCVEPDDPAPVPTGSLDEVAQAILSLRQGWRFRTDPSDEGVAQSWYATGYDDCEWADIEAGQSWEEQGYPGYDGLGWYRQWVSIPSSWQGSTLRLIASGVDDEYDLYINGELLRHYGQYPDRSVWGWQTIARVDPAIDFGGENLIALRVNDWGGDGGIWRDVALRRSVPLDGYRAFLPEPIIDEAPAWLELYWAAWQMAWDKVAFGTAENGLAEAYMDEGFNEQIYQWDSCFIALFGRYGARLFPVMATLDNFYERQRPDGYIQRVYSETDGQQIGEPTADEPMVNPPLFSWVERAYYQSTADASRLETVLPKLEQYFGWLEQNLRAPEGQGLYYQTDLGSGMDNTPRGAVGHAGWVDMSAQQALAALELARIAEALGQSDRQALWQQKHAEIAGLIEQHLYSSADGYYYDALAAGGQAGVKHIGAFWTVLAQVADDDQLAELAGHLSDPAEFARPHRFPTLAASEPAYSAAGHYWRGGVWAPTNYMIVRGLGQRGFFELAREAAESHLDHLAEVYASPPTDEQAIAPEERDGEYQTLWECYAPELAQPATRWDDTYYSRQDFVGWSGLGPIAMLLETVLGFEVYGAEGRIVWRLHRSDRHGVERLQLGSDNLVDLVARARAEPGAAVVIDARSQRAFPLELRRPGREPVTVTVCPGSHAIAVD